MTSIVPRNTTSAVLRPSCKSSVSNLPAFRRRSQTSMGVKVRDGPLWPANSPAIKRKLPALFCKAMLGMSPSRMVW
ncbi:hypothetical protein D3C79_1017070 [compost metagenome]